MFKSQLGGGPSREIICEMKKWCHHYELFIAISFRVSLFIKSDVADDSGKCFGCFNNNKEANQQICLSVISWNSMRHNVNVATSYFPVSRELSPWKVYDFEIDRRTGCAYVLRSYLVHE